MRRGLKCIGKFLPGNDSHPVFFYFFIPSPILKKVDPRIQGCDRQAKIFICIYQLNQEYIIERKESILLHYSTMYHSFTEVSDLSSVIHNLRFHSLHNNLAIVGMHTCSMRLVLYLFVLQFVVNLQQNGKQSSTCGMPRAAVG